MSKQIFLVLVFAFLGMAAYSQQDVMKREYGYDAVGNRVLRKVFEMRSQKSMNEEENENEADANAEEERFFVDNVGDVKLKIVPNPTTSVVRFQIEDAQNEIDGEIILYTLTSAKITSQRITSSHTEIDMSSYPTGTYLATVVINGKMSYYKIVKQ